MNDAAAQRRFYAEEIQITSNIESAALVDALVAVPRDRFLPPGPWTIRGEADFQAPPRRTPDANPRHVHHNIAVGIDPDRMLFNGAPGLVARMIDLLALRRGSRVLHVGTGLGYYTALVAHCVGENGRVLGIEVDADLAGAARSNLPATAPSKCGRATARNRWRSGSTRSSSTPVSHTRFPPGSTRSCRGGG